MSLSPPKAQPAPDAQDAADAAQLASLGYSQKLTRALGLWSNFAVGFTYLSPLVGVYSVFDYGLATGGPSFFWTIPLVLIGQGLVLLMFAEVASQYPIAGGIYQWAKRLVGPKYAWMSGWMYTWALLVTITSVAYPIAKYAGPLFGYAVTGASTIATTVVVILLCAAVNLLGVRRLAFVANIGVAAEVLGTVGFGLYLLFFHANRSVGSVLHTYGAGAGGIPRCLPGRLPLRGVDLLRLRGVRRHRRGGQEPVPQDPPGDGHDPAACGGVATVVLTLGLIVAVPDFGEVISGKDRTRSVTALAARSARGVKFALALIVVGFVSCTLAIQAAATRLVYSFGRDGMIVGARALVQAAPEFHMPPVAIAVTAVVPAALALLPAPRSPASSPSRWSASTSASSPSCWPRSSAARRGWSPAGTFTLGHAGAGRERRRPDLWGDGDRRPVRQERRQRRLPSSTAGWSRSRSASSPSWASSTWVARPKERIADENRSDR